MDHWLDAIIVPATRTAKHVRNAAALAAATEALLVVLTSRDCRPEAAAEVVERTPGCRGLIIEVPLDHPLPTARLDTSSPSWHPLNAHRVSDLSLKRNLGLLLARLNGWGKVLFLDDDVSRVTPQSLLRMAAQLDHAPIAGMEMPSFPDNSVVCHARRKVGLHQDVFVSGAVLAVNCDTPDLGFFPDIYNEDWFFFARAAAQGRIRFAGEARQAGHDPFADPSRAAREEFGDVLAEGVFNLFHHGLDVPGATLGYWSEFLEVRHDVIEETLGLLDALEDNESFRARTSLRTAQDQLGKVQPQDCVDFLAAWESDRAHFDRAVSRLPRVGSQAQALDQLGLTSWLATSFGGATSLSRSSTRPSSPGMVWRSPVGRKPIRS